MTRDRTAGFTLLEMLVVLAILGLAGGIAYPAMDRAVQAQAFATRAAQVELGVRAARADAIRQDRTVAVPSFAPGDARTTIALARGKLGGDVAVTQSSGGRFYRDGSSNGGTIALTSGGRVFRIVIDAPTGVITAGRS